MAFLFDCPHCTQSFEAELDLCGSTCNCPSCGQLFLVPELDAEVRNSILQHTVAFTPAAADDGGSGAVEIRAAVEKEELPEKAEAPVEAVFPSGEVFAEERARLEARLQSAGLALEGALRRLSEAEAEAVQNDAVRAGLEAELKKAVAAAERNEKEFKAERKSLAARLEASEAALRLASEREKQGEALNAELAQLRLQLDEVLERKSALEEELLGERERFDAKLGALQTALSVAVERADKAEQTAGFGSDVPRLRSELDRLAAEKAALEKELSEEDVKFKAKLREVESDRESLANQTSAAQSEAVAALGEVATLKAETAALKTQLQEALRASTPAPAPQELSMALENELLEQIAKRDATIKRLSNQLDALSLDVPSMSMPSDKSGSRVFGNPLPVAIFTLALGLGIGWLSSRSADGPAGPVSESKDKLRSGATPPPIKPSGAQVPPAASSAGGIASTSSSAAPVEAAKSSEPSAPDAPAEPPAPPPQAPPASNAGLPSRLPDSFLGLKFGTPLMDITVRGQWQETSGKRHRKAELLGAGVEAVLTPDDLDHLLMGSYVRVAARQPESLAPFLEWAVNVQDAVSALYGQPSRMHQITGATEAAEVVKKISTGEDFYEAVWERDGDDTIMTLSIRVFNERSVVFRLEYRSRELTAAALERQAAAAERVATELGKEPKAGSSAKPLPSGGGAEGKAPTEVRTAPVSVTQ